MHSIEPERGRVPIAPLDPETFGKARLLAPGWDVDYLEREWRVWVTESPRDADAAFPGFCRKWSELGRSAGAAPDCRSSVAAAARQTNVPNRQDESRSHDLGGR